LAKEAEAIHHTRSNAETDTGEKDTDNEQLQQSAYILIIEILAVFLGMNDNETTQARLFIGQESMLIQIVLNYLAEVVDKVLSSTKNSKSEDPNMQRNVILSLRFVANISFKCRNNQDIMRSPLPPSRQFKSEEESDGMANRTALHMLLSCTGLSPEYLGIREWAIVAIRNVLAGNLENQRIVGELEAQKPVQSAELERLGIQVKMNNGGKVSVRRSSRSISQNGTKSNTTDN